MPRARHTTLTHFLIEQRRRFPSASGAFNTLVLDVASAGKAIAQAVERGHLDNVERASLGAATHVRGELQRKLDLFSNDCFLRFTEGSSTLAGAVSEDLPAPYAIPVATPRGKYLLIFDPLDGSTNVDVNAPVGSVFSVLRAPEPDRDATAQDFLQRGCEQIAAGYVLYGPATMLVLSVGSGVHGFTLDPSLGDFLLTHENLRIAAETQEFAIDSSNARFWETPVRRYVNECVAGVTGVRGKDFNMRWLESVVADTHRLLVRGGVLLYPRHSTAPAAAGRLPLLYEANPLAFLVEQAGGRASTGSEPVLGVQPTDIHQRTGLVLGSTAEVERIERYHSEPNTLLSGDPLFAERGLFRI